MSGANASPAGRSQEVMDRPRRPLIIGFFALLLVVDWFLYFRHAGHFFQGDTIFLLNHRATSISGFMKEFVELNPSGWYRPLANELFESILYPFAGLQPIPYRIPVYVVFFAITIAVYALALKLTRRHLTAALAAFFFSIHNANAYTTYDLGFIPELQYTLFYIVAVLCFLRYFENGNRTAYVLSLVFFIAGLLSKEAAVTLPGTLFVAAVLYDPVSKTFGARLSRAMRSIAPHALVLVAYLFLAIGYLQVQGFSIARMFDSSQELNYGDYVPVVNGAVLKNADVALSWAFNLPRGAWKEWQADSGVLGYLKFFRILAFALIVPVLFRTERRAILFGWIFFWITVFPGLLLVAHFLPYYLFLPVAGLSVVVGSAFTWLHDRIHPYRPVLATAVVVLLFGGVLYSTNPTIQGNIRHNTLLGASSTLASNSLSDLKARYPALPEGVTLYFADSSSPLGWHHDFGGLVRMAYGTDDIAVVYASNGDLLHPETPALVFEVQNGRLVDDTGRFNPDRFMKFSKSDLVLNLSTDDVQVGDKYSLSIVGLHQAVLRIAYTIGEGPLRFFDTRLNEEGKATFTVEERTQKGDYTFWAFKLQDSQEWINAEHRKLRVR